MRVTKAIREYVEEEIRRKYQAKKDEVGKEYYAEREDVKNRLQDILDKANEEADQYMKSVRYACLQYRVVGPAFGWRSTPTKPEQEDIISKERQLIEAKCSAKIKQVLFDLEMGETAKAELKDVLDNLVID